MMNLPAGVTKGQAVEVAPKSQPMTTAALDYLAKQRRREAEEMEAILARRQQAEQERQEQARREAEAKAQAEQEKREKAAQEARKWEEINAALMPTGHQQIGGVKGFDRTIIASALVLPMLVDGELVVKDAGLSLRVSELVSPIVPQGAADLLAAMYQDEADRRWWAEVERTRKTLGDGPWLYTAAMPSVTVSNAGPAESHTGKPAHSHKVIRAVWGECYIHNPIHTKE